jgi:tRNA (guanine-N7-)-methyltransferase
MTIDEIMIPEPAEGQIVDPQTLFASSGPFELEIGCGKGGFLLSRARANPDIRMLGIEWANKYFRYCADRMARRGLTNVRVMRTDAKVFVMRHLLAESVDALHLYHPDPWPKKRHHKRRLVQADFVAAAVRCIKPGGLWLAQSDHDEYFDQIARELAAHPELRPIDWDETGRGPGGEWAGTNFEIKFSKAGSRIHRAAFRREG